ncbi:MAG: DMT family transporter [Bacteroidota bacterium]
MITNHLGEFAALLTAVFWTFTALAFTDAGHRIGSLAVNFWRLVIGITLLTAFAWIYYDMPIPVGIPTDALIWLALSGFVGIFLGDLFLFKAFTIIGPRVSLLIMSLSPPLAAFISWFSMGEKLTYWDLVGMTLTMTGIIMVILKGTKAEGRNMFFSLRHSPKGVFFALLGAIGQASGLVMSKLGVLKAPNAFSATQIRVVAGMIGFIILITFLKRWKPVILSIKNARAAASLSIGSFFGPFLGISFSLIAVSYANPGIVQTIVSINPILIIPFSVWFFKEKITWREVIGAVIAVAGVMVFFVV